MWNLHTSPTHGYIFSRAGDTLAFALPIFISVVSLPFLYAFVPEDVIPLWAYIIVVALTDVGHVWTTLFRCYLDTEENQRRPWLYNLTPVLMFSLSFALHFFISESFFWTLLGYLAIFHFVRQQFGFLMLAKRRGRDLRNMKRDTALLYLGAGIPIVLWHLDQTRKFDWFNRDDQFIHTAVSNAARKVVAGVVNVASSGMLLSTSNSSSASSSASSSSGGSYMPLGRWASRLWMENHHHDNGHDQQLFCSQHDCFGNPRIPSGKGGWGDFGPLSIGIYLAGFLATIAVVVSEQREQQQQQRQKEQQEHNQDETQQQISVFPFYTTKHVILIGTWVTWGFGVLCPHRVVALAFLNLFHAFPTFAVTFCATFNRWLLGCRHYYEEQQQSSRRSREGRTNKKTDEEEEQNDLDHNKSILDRFSLWLVFGSSDGGRTSPFLSVLQKTWWSKKQQRQQTATINHSSIRRPTTLAKVFADLEGEKRNTTGSNKNNNDNNNDKRKLLCFAGFVLFLFFLGLVEEYLWECLVWQDFTDQLWEFNPTSHEDFPPAVYSAVTAILILPQATHYFLDAFLWKHSHGENPGLAVNLAMETARDVPEEWLCHSA